MSTSRQVRIVAKHHSEPDSQKLARAYIELARLAIAEAEREADAATESPDEQEAA